MGASLRFEAIRDPQDLWCIWDNETDKPAEFAQMALVGLTEHEARTAIAILNSLYERLRIATRKNSAA